MSSNRLVLLLPALILVLLTACGKPPQILVESQPPAAVWEGEELLGQTPLALPPASRDRQLVLRHPGYRDAVLEVPAGHRDLLAATLEPLGGYTLACTSQPGGASVFLDGELVGQTPVTLHDLDRDTVEITFQLQNHEQASRSVSFAENPRQEVAVVLANLTEQYYLQQLSRAPEEVHPYCDLAHHYILQNEFPKAVAVFSRGVDLLVNKPDTGNASRLWAEIDNLTVKQYNYGGAPEVLAARLALLKGLEEMLERHGDNAPVNLYIAQINLLDTLDRRQRAQELFEKAWKRHPNERQLQQVAKQRRLHIP
ncbi:MAG: PEGA domain-containing protein [Lentisphaeria bacterium]|jgi:tetratricopeptide (TPR) repeat protein|nr:PEGA domain-containing protein [Lentisphaeria bacterium]